MQDAANPRPTDEGCQVDGLPEAQDTFTLMLQLTVLNCMPLSRWKMIASNRPKDSLTAVLDLIVSGPIAPSTCDEMVHSQSQLVSSLIVPQALDHGRGSEGTFMVTKLMPFL